jgi:hypothetical protein
MFLQRFRCTLAIAICLAFLFQSEHVVAAGGADHYQTATDFFRKGDLDAALSELQIASADESADVGFSSADFLVGLLYLRSDVRVRDAAKSRSFLSRAAQRGNTRAAMILSAQLATSTDVFADPQAGVLKTARAYAVQAVSSGDPDARLLLSWFQFYGIGGERNVSQARRDYSDAIDDGGVLQYEFPPLAKIESGKLSRLRTIPPEWNLSEKSFSNVAVIAFSEAAANSITNGPKTIFLNGSKLDVRPDKSRMIVVLAPEGRYTIKSVVGGFFDQNLDYMKCTDTEFSMDVAAGEVHEFVLQRYIDESNGHLCSVTRFTKTPAVSTESHQLLEQVLSRENSAYYLLNIGTVESLTFEGKHERQSMHQSVRSIRARVMQLLDAYLREGFIRLPSQGSAVMASVAARKEEQTRRDAARAAEARRTALDSSRQAVDSGAELSRSLVEAKEKCREIGFKANTPAFGKCVLQLSK